MTAPAETHGDDPDLDAIARAVGRTLSTGAILARSVATRGSFDGSTGRQHDDS